MRMSMNEKKALYAFGCPNREATVERLRFAAALAPDPAAKKLFFTLAVKLSDEDCNKWYRCFYYNMRLEVEHFAHHKYHSDSQPISVRERLLNERSFPMNPKYQKVCADIAKTEKKVEDLQAQLKELYDKKTELENLEIINTVRAMVMDKDQIMAFLSNMKGSKPEIDEYTEVSEHE